MRPIDYGRSFVTTDADFNSPRFLVESRCRIADGPSGDSETFCQCASCKSEDTFAEKDLFYEDNYDFLPVFGERNGIIFRRKAWLNENYKTVQPVEAMWGGPILCLVEADTVRELSTTSEIRVATRRAEPIVAQTEISSEETGLRVLIECPVKTMNMQDRGDLYQVDTGPILLPDLTRGYENAAEGLSLAFVAFNRPDVADFVVEVPTPILEGGKEACRIYHYSERVSLPAVNRLFALQ